VNGEPWSDDAVRLLWNEVRGRVDLPGEVRLHDLRHAALTILATRGTLSGR